MRDEGEEGKENAAPSVSVLAQRGQPRPSWAVAHAGLPPCPSWGWCVIMDSIDGNGEPLQLQFVHASCVIPVRIFGTRAGIVVWHKTAA